MKKRKQLFLRNGDCQNVVVPSRRVVFMCVGKCASSALRGLAFQLNGCTERGEIQGYKVSKEQIVEHYKEWKKVAIIRNPWARLVSVWDHKVRRTNYHNFRDIPGFAEGMSFHDFAILVQKIQDSDKLVDGHFRSQYCFLYHGNTYLPTHTFRFEALKRRRQRGWRKLYSVCEILDTIKLVHKHQSKNAKHYSKYYDAALVETVRKRYEIDVNGLGYEFQREE